MWPLYFLIASVLLLSSVSAKPTSGVSCGRTFFLTSKLEKAASTACTAAYRTRHDALRPTIYSFANLEEAQRYYNLQCKDAVSQPPLNTPSPYLNFQGLFDSEGGPYITWFIPDGKIVNDPEFFIVAKWDGTNCAAAGAVWIDGNTPKKCHKGKLKSSM